MTPPGVFLRYFRSFYRRTGHRLLWLVAIVVIMSYAEGVGITLFFPFFSGGSSAGQPDPIRWLFGVLGVSATPRAVLPLIVAVFVLKGLLQLVALTYQSILSSSMARTDRSRIIASIGRADYLQVIGTSSGFYANLLTHEVSRSALAFVYFARAIPPAIGTAIFTTILLVLDWKLTVAALAMGVAVFVGFRLPARIVRRSSEIVTREHGGLAALLVQCLQSFKYLRATASFGAIQRQVDAAAVRLGQLESRSGAAMALLLSAVQPLMVVFIAGVLFVRLDGDPGRTASLFVVLVFVFRIMNDVFSLQQSWQTFRMLSGSVDVVERSLDELERRVEPTGGRRFTGLRESLACVEVGFGYTPERLVLRDVSLSIPRNASVGIVGGSGAGKSTLADLLLGVLRPTGGRVTVDGTDLRELILDDYRRRVAYVPQEPVIFDDTIASNITLWRPAPPERLRDVARSAHALAFIEATPRGFDTVVGDRGVQLSGGQRQRIAIARELFRSPEILILDEATSELDAESERAIQESIEELRGQVTIVVIAHRLSTIRSCDLIAVLDDGRLVEQGSYADLFAAPRSRFRAMCDLQGLLPQPTAGR